MANNSPPPVDVTFGSSTNSDPLWISGDGLLEISGSFSATITLQRSFQGGPWVTVT